MEKWDGPSIALAGGTKIPGLYFGERELGDQGLLRTKQKKRGLRGPPFKKSQ